MKKHAKFQGQFSTGAHFSKMIHAGKKEKKKNISSSSDELSVLPVGFTWERWGREEDVSVHSHTNAREHARDRMAAAADPCSLWNKVAQIKALEHALLYKKNNIF